MKYVVLIPLLAVVFLSCQESTAPLVTSQGASGIVTPSLSKSSSPASISVIDPQYQAEVVADGLSGPEGFDVMGGGVMYVVQSELSNVVKVNPSGKVSQFASIPFPGPAAGTLVGLRIDPSRGMFISQLRYGNILRLTMAGELSVFVSGLNYPAQMQFDSRQNLIVSELFAERVVSIDQAGKVSPLILTPGDFDGRIQGFAIDDVNRLYAMSHISGVVRRFDISEAGHPPYHLADGQVICTVPGANLNNRATGLEFGFEGDLIASTSYELYRIRPTGEISLFVTGLAGFYNVTKVLPNGDIIVADHHRAIPGAGIIYRISKKH